MLDRQSHLMQCGTCPGSGSPQNQPNTDRINPDHGTDECHHWKRAGRYTSGADATQDAYCHDHRLLTKTEVHTKKLRQENDGQTFKQCRAILISSCTNGQYETRNFFGSFISSATRSAVGKVALLEAVENAIKVAS